MRENEITDGLDFSPFFCSKFYLRISLTDYGKKRSVRELKVTCSCKKENETNPWTCRKDFETEWKLKGDEGTNIIKGCTPATEKRDCEPWAYCG